MDEVRWGHRKYFLLFKSRPAVYRAYFTVPHDERERNSEREYRQNAYIREKERQRERYSVFEGEKEIVREISIDRMRI